MKKGRTHETLVNEFSDWLAAKGLVALRNRAIDIGLTDPPVIVEAKVVKSWATATRQAVGQLYEYKYFQVVAPDSRLVFLASKPPPDDWFSYLESDRHIAVVWKEGNDFVLSDSARQAFNLWE